MKMDLLSNILNVMKLTGTLYFRTSFAAPWGVEVPRFENVSKFHYVHRGRCFARIEDQGEALFLEQGDLVIIPRGALHTLSDPAEVETLTVDQVVADSDFSGRGARVHGGADSGHETQLICDHFAFDPGASHVLIDALPQYLHIKDDGNVSPDWLDDTLKIIGSELGRDRLGSDLIALKLSEIIFTQAVRHYLKSDGKQQRGLAGFADRNLRLALEAVHRDAAAQWSMNGLAKMAGMSRTAFSSRFNELVGSTPLAYLTAW
jgi:AraC family transcriptional activator of mtrCDE